ncbi:MAG: VWA domain-containing protein [Armatimonadetes bacterium]|nr:VWA domain-containing protein [Armatimonadota bacterium]MDW8121349.1 VWA domain-containing protein [Armatimonadota bacterium]
MKGAFWDIAAPQFFWALVPWAVVVAGILWGLKIKRRSLHFWLGPESLERWWQRAKTQAFLLALSTLFLVVAMVRPRIALGTQQVVAQGADIVICLDISHSMLCEDLRPSRLEMAQAIIFNLIQRCEPDDRVALVLFGGTAFPLTPLTSDFSLIDLYLRLLEPSILALNPTTFIEEGLKVSVRLLKKRAEEGTRGRLIVLLSDGEDQGSNWKAAATSCRKEGVPVIAVVVGTRIGSAVPQLDSSGRMRGYKRDRDGRIVISRANEDILRQIAQMTGGQFLRVVDGKREVGQIRDEIQRHRRQVSARAQANWTEIFPLFLLLSFLLIVGEIKLRRPVE